MDNLIALRKQLKEMKKKVLQSWIDTFPVGSLVTFEKGNATIHAEILDHSDSWWCDHRILIRNIETRNEYTIYAFWLLDRKDW